jgi:hypothetical protein
MSIKKLMAFAGAIALGACASAPEDIPPAYVSEATYAGWTCEQLAKESAQLNSALATASRQQDDARTGDTVGVIFLGLPISSMTGGNVASEVARLKGHTNAVRQAMIKQSCAAAPPQQTVEQRRAEIKAKWDAKITELKRTQCHGYGAAPPCNSIRDAEAARDAELKALGAEQAQAAAQ